MAASVGPRQRGDQLLASLGQERLWVLSSLTGAGPAYNVAVAVRLSGDLRPHDLVAALSQLCSRHDSLRTTFTNVDGRPVCEVAPPGQPCGKVLVQEFASMAEAEQAMHAAAALPFDFTDGPPWRAAIYTVGPHEGLLLLVTHHMVGDGWSLGILLRELAVLYTASVQGAPARLDPLPFGYPDYAAWQRRRLDRGEADASLRYWRQRLAGVPPLELATDRSRPPVASLRGGSVRLPLPGDVATLLPGLCGAHGVTAYMVGLAALVALLTRYTGQRDFCLGVPVADRTTPGTEALVGFLVNNLVLRFQVSVDSSFEELLRYTRETVLTALAHQDVPFEWLVEELDPGRDLSRNPLFQVVFTDEHNPLEGVRLPGLTVEDVPIDLGVSKFDLSVSFAAAAPVPVVSGHFSADLFEADTITRLLRNYTTLLSEAVRSPRTRIRDLPTMPPDEQQMVVYGWNRTAVALPHTTICELIAERTRQAPDAPAIRTPTGTLSYRELEDRATRLAGRLTSLGAGPGVPVGLLLPRCADAIVALVAILRAGAAYVPLDPSHPAQRIGAVLDDAGITLVVSAQEWSGLAAPRSIVSVDGTDPQPTIYGPASNARPNELAYVIYTSGSTGHPKGVAVDHRALVRFVHQPVYGTLSPDQIRLQLSPYTFDASLIEVWGTLSSGGCVAIPDYRLDFLGQVTQGVLELGADTALFISPQLRLVVEHRPGLLPRMREVQVGGDMLAVHHGRRAAQLLGDGTLSHTYGPTECTLFATWSPVDAEARTATLPIGKPITNTRCYVLDERLNPMPIGVPGELFLAGPGLAWGYVGRAAMTAGSFRPDPFGELPGERMYATGDRVRWLASGELEFLGRLDSQIKLHGYRIELGEVEHALNDQPGVLEGLVVLRGDAPGGPALVGYVVLSAGVSAAAVRQGLRRRLPDYMVPAHVVAVERIPLTGNGKADRTRLPPPQPQHSRHAPSADAVESTVLGLWQEALGVDEPIPVNVKFFDAGGNSVNIMKLHVRIQQVFPEAGLSPAELFTYTTVQELAERLRDSIGG